MKPLVIKYLETHTFEQLEGEHGVRARPSSGFEKINLNYDQIKVKSSDPLASQCRGLVIRPQWASNVDVDTYLTTKIDNVQVVAWPMNRFFNHGDVAAADVDWSDPNLQIFEKLDGTMCVLYYDDVKYEWHVSTRSIPEADLLITNNGIGINHTFASLFKLAVSHTAQDVFGVQEGFENAEQFFDYFTSKLDCGRTYVFELTTPLNRVVVRYGDYRVTLLAVRHNESGLEQHIHDVDEELVLKCRSWGELNDPQTLSAFVNASDPSKIEGAVAMDSQFQRVKIKSAAWVMASRAKELVTVSRRNAIEAIINGSVDDIVPLLEKEIVDELHEMQKKLVAYASSVDKQFATISKTAATRKDFALAVKSLNIVWTTPYFQLYKLLIDGKRVSMLDWLTTSYEEGRITVTSLDNILQQIDKISVI